MMLKKFPFIALDIETRNLTAAQAEFAAQFLKHHPSTKDEEKRAAQIAAKKAALSERGALNDASEVACIGLWTPSEPAPIVLHTFPFGEEIEGIAHAQYATEKDMLNAFTEMMNDACDEQTEVVVANAGFDLPRLRYAAAIRNRVAMPEIIKPRSVNPIYDVLYMAGKYFLVGSGTEFSLSLDNLSRHFNLPVSTIPGSEMPAMIERGEFKDVIVHNAEDALKTGIIYQGLTGR